MNALKIIGIAAGLLVAGAAGLSALNPENFAETSENAKDEVLRTRHYQVDLPTFAAEIEKVAPTLTTYGQSWKLTAAEITGKSAVFQIEVPVVVFTDDLEIKANSFEKTDETTVNIRSASRVGKSDLGENRRHVLQILEILDARFAKNQP